MSEGPAPPAPPPEIPGLSGEDPGFWTKGKISNGCSLLLLLAGLGLSAAAGAPAWLAAAAPWALAAGLFGFAGGITNWLAVKMLFDRVPGLYGSGVIPARFREIRANIKTLIMTHFFEEDYLRRFFEERGFGGQAPRLGEAMRALLDTEEADRAIEAELESLKQGPMGMMIGMAGPDAVKLLARQFVGALIDRLAPMVEERLRADPAAGIPALREQVDALLEAKLEELTPAVVKEMMEQVMRRHLGWLIVWGNVFGGLIGLLSRAVAAGWGLRGVP